MTRVREGVIGKDHSVGEIGQLLNSEIDSRQGDLEITVYHSLDIALQDLYSACLLLKQALKQGAGTQVAD